MDHPRRRKAHLERESIFRPRRSWTVYKQFSMCINCMLCYAACPVYGLDRGFHGAGCNRPGSALQHGFTGSGVVRAPRTPSRTTKESGAALLSESAPRFARRHVDPAGAIQQYKVTATTDWFKSLVMPRGSE